MVSIAKQESVMVFLVKFAHLAILKEINQLLLKSINGTNKSFSTYNN